MHERMELCRFLQSHPGPVCFKALVVHEYLLALCYIPSCIVLEARWISREDVRLISTVTSRVHHRSDVEVDYHSQRSPVLEPLRPVPVGYRTRQPVREREDISPPGHAVRENHITLVTAPVDQLAHLYVSRGEQAPSLSRRGSSMVWRGQRLAVLALPVRVPHRWGYGIHERLRGVNDLCVDLAHRGPVLDGGKGLVGVVPQWCAVHDIPYVVERHSFPADGPLRLVRVDRIAYVRNLLLVVEIFTVIDGTEHLVPPRGVHVVISEYLLAFLYISSCVEPPVAVQLPR
mmetsp:Transcript_13379/g.30459  ORF Transcript_13379/g.30459 Transcript_13379/m.30459 type:complete len:288 (+) Transcript_13379:11-874(+)